MTAGALLPVWRTASVLFFFFSSSYPPHARMNVTLFFVVFFLFLFFFYHLLLSSLCFTCRCHFEVDLFSPLFIFVVHRFLFIAAVAQAYVCFLYWLLVTQSCSSFRLFFFFFRILCFSAIMTPIFLVSFFFSVLSRRLRRPLACFCFAQ